MKIENDSIIRVNPDVLTTLVDDELGMMNVESGFYYTLSPVGKEIWDIIGREKSFETLKRTLMKQYKVSEEQCHREVLELLESMHINGLIKIEG
jgi:hypothetical protein